MKQFLRIAAVLVFLFAGCAAALSLARDLTPTTGEAPPDVYARMQDPDSYRPDGADGVAEIITGTGLAETRAVNNVAAVVFDYRGFDTLGESFILLTAISGSFVVLHRRKKTPKQEEDAGHEA